MERKYRIFDTNVYSAYKNSLTDQDHKQSALSLVVFYELTATKITGAKRRRWEQLIGKFLADDLLIVPTADDWINASRGIWLMHRNNEPIPKDAAVLQNDVLICVSALSFAENTPFIVTENIKHFQIIADYVNENRRKKSSKLIIVSAKEYFGK